jgi:hypothetical protein
LRRNLIILDLLLLALCALAVWRFMDYRRERRAEQSRFLARREAGYPPPAIPLPPPPAPATASAYVQVAQELLLSPDRNPDVIVDVVAPKPMPPLPRAYGAFSFGQGPRVVLAERAGSRQHSYPIGGQIGPFKVLAITQAGVVFDWEGRRVAARYQDMRDLTASGAESASAGRPAPPVPASSATRSTPAAAELGENKSNLKSLSSNSDVRGKLGAGGSEYRTCLKGDDSPDGTITEGFRKVVVPSPMGNSCHWEKVQ